MRHLVAVPKRKRRIILRFWGYKVENTTTDHVPTPRRFRRVHPRVAPSLAKSAATSPTRWRGSKTSSISTGRDAGLVGCSPVELPAEGWPPRARPRGGVRGAALDGRGSEGGPVTLRAKYLLDTNILSEPLRPVPNAAVMARLSGARASSRSRASSGTSCSSAWSECPRRSAAST